jgi:hypothetical protein
MRVVIDINLSCFQAAVTYRPAIASRCFRRFRSTSTLPPIESL